MKRYLLTLSGPVVAAIEFLRFANAIGSPSRLTTTACRETCGTHITTAATSWFIPTRMVVAQKMGERSWCSPGASVLESADLRAFP